MAWSSKGYVFIIPALILVHLVVAPYTKVEESFNIQAIYDLLHYGVPVKNAALKFRALFDHMTFSGSVPRTFVGALVLAGLSKPLIILNGLSGLAAQITGRNFLGLANAASIVAFITSVRKAYGNRTAVWYAIFQASQFHVFFYASRTLPNMFAFCFSTFASASLLPGPTAFATNRINRLRRAFYLLTFAAVIFRSELALLVASNAAYEILKSGNIDNAYTMLRRVIVPAVLVAGIASAVISICIDTYLWQADHFFLPELTAFWFNIFPTDHQGASEWGTSPWHWYFTSALPRLLLGPSLLLIPYGVFFTTQRTPLVDALVPSLLYIAAYSILPHKETRFIFPTIPNLTLATAIPASYLSLRRDPTSRLLITLLTLSAAFTGFISHAILLPLSAQSYPGGVALQALHTYHYSNSDSTIPSPQPPLIHVHLTNLALQTGITRFLEQPAQRKTSVWVYDKSPTINGTASTAETTTFLAQFDYVVIEPAHVLYLEASPAQWTKVASASSLRRSRPRIVSDEANRGCLVLSCVESREDADGLYDLFRAMYGSYGAWMYGALHDVLRQGYGVGRRFTKGYWIDWGLEESLVVFRQG